MIKLLIVDDSALMRRQLSSFFIEEGDFEIHFARNGREAVEENINFQPDVVTLDINMPEMDGLSALSLIMAELDYVAKPSGTISLSIGDIRDELIRKVRMAARARIKTTSSALSTRQPLVKKTPIVESAPIIRRGGVNKGIVVIGVSTGGPRTLEDILPLFPANFPYPILVAQHMPASFTLPFANRMNDLCELQVVEASRPTTIETGFIYIGKGGADMVVAQRGGKPTIIPKPENSQFLWHPSVELLGRSVLENYEASHIIAVMLTGMGYDGSDAFTEIKKRGGRTIAESEASCVVFGMPAELISKGGASVVLPADRITKQVLAWLK
ncbi:MAG: chemotaxis response regulator CheB [Pseudomonadota bacterium]